MHQYEPGIGPIPTNYSLFTGRVCIKSFAIEYALLIRGDVSSKIG